MQVSRVQQHKYKKVCTCTKHKTNEIRRLVRTNFRQWQDDGRRKRFSLQVLFLLLVLLSKHLSLKALMSASHRSCMERKIAPFWGSPRHVLDSRFDARDSFQIPGNGFPRLCQCNLDSGFQSLVGFPIPRAVLWIPNPGFQIPQAEI